MSQRVTVAQALELAIQHHNAGRLDDAESIYSQILDALPDHHDALHLLGLVAHEREEHVKAAELIGRAVALAPQVGEMHGNLALVLQDLGRDDDAIAHFETALSISPDFAEGHHNLGLLLQGRGDLEAALGHFERAVTLAPDFVEARCHFADTLLECGRPEESIPHYRHALSVDPSLAPAHANLGAALLAFGNTADALDSLRRAVRLDRDSDANWVALAAGIERMRVDSLDDAFRDEILTLLDHQAVDPQTVVPAFLPALHAILQDDGPFPDDPLLLRALTLSPFRDLDIEATLTARRRALLCAVPEALPFACALAQHCFLNEYVFAVTEAEESAVAELAETSDLAPIALATLATYRPLHEVEGAEKWTDREWPAPLKAVIQKQVTEPMEERRLRAKIPALTPI